MAIEFNCPECSAMIRVPDNASGKKGSCPSCKVKLRVPKVDIPDAGAAPAPQPAQPSPPPEPTPEPSVDPSIPPRPDFMAPPPAAAPPAQAPVVQPGQVAPVAPQAPAQPVQQPVFPQAPGAPAAPAFPGPPGVAGGQPPAPQFPGQQFPSAPQPAAAPQPGAPQFPGPPQPAAPQTGAQQFPGPPPGQIVPQVAPAQSVSRKAARLARRKRGGMLFPIICGLALAGGLGWMYLNLGPDLEGPRVAYSQGVAMMPMNSVSPSMTGLQSEITSAVLTHFEEDPETLRTQLIETRFTAAGGELQIQVLTGSDTHFVRFPIDADLRSWYDSNRDDLDAPRRKNFTASLKDFFTDWDVAIRNQSGVEDPLKYRDDVALTACVSGLGYHVQAMVGSTPFRCVFEDDGNLYFLIPRTHEKFKINGRPLRKDGPSLFPGEYEITIRPDRKKAPAAQSGNE